jgi:hypothetical protein
MLNLTAPGGSLSSFSTSVVAPGPVTGLVPAIPIGPNVPSHSLAQDLSVAWTPDASSTKFQLTLSSGLGSSVISCSEAQSKGSLVVDHSLYSGVGIMNNTMVSMTAMNGNEVDVTSGPASYRVWAWSKVGGTVAMKFTP